MSPRKVTYSRKSTHAARAAHARGEKEFRTYDTSAIRPKKSKAPLIALIAAVAVVVVIIVALFVNTSCAEAANDHLAPMDSRSQYRLPKVLHCPLSQTTSTMRALSFVRANSPLSRMPRALPLHSNQASIPSRVV